MKDLTINFRNGNHLSMQIDDVNYDNKSHTIHLIVTHKICSNLCKKELTFNSSDILTIKINEDLYTHTLCTIIKCCERCAYRDVPTRFEPCKRCLAQSQFDNDFHHSEFIDRNS